MENKFTIEEVKNFWDQMAPLYDQINEKIGSTHYQRFSEALKYLALKNGAKVLNVWSRTGEAIPFLKSQADIELYNLEVSPQMLAIAQKKFSKEKFQLTNLEQLNFPDDYFEAILSLETLEHTPKPETLLKEFYRVLKPDQKLVMSLPPKTAELPLKIYELFFTNHGEGPHRFLSSKTVKALLKKSNFEIIIHKGTVLIPVGPNFIKNFGEKIINLFQQTFISELGIRQFYVAKKPS